MMASTVNQENRADTAPVGVLDDPVGGHTGLSRAQTVQVELCFGRPFSNAELAKLFPIVPGEEPLDLFTVAFDIEAEALLRNGRGFADPLFGATRVSPRSRLRKFPYALHRAEEVVVPLGLLRIGHETPRS